MITSFYVIPLFSQIVRTMTDALDADQAPAIDGAQIILNAAILQLID